MPRVKSEPNTIGKKLEKMMDEAFVDADHSMQLFRAWIELKAMTLFEKVIKYPIEEAIFPDDLSYLNLSTRAENGLRRMGLSTIGDVVSKFESIEDFQYARNLGKNSAKEIMLAIFLYQFSALDKEGQKRYAEHVISMNMED